VETLKTIQYREDIEEFLERVRDMCMEDEDESEDSSAVVDV
jgi:hypothetical protein